MSPDLRPIRIGGREVGPGVPLFVIAEVGLNHGGSVDRALVLVDAAAAAGVSAVKLQTLTAAELVAPSPTRDFFAPFELDEHAHLAIAARARAHGLALIATPLSLAAVDLLERVGFDAYKIASGDITFTQLIERCAATGKPLIISTGVSELAEVTAAVDVARRAGALSVAVLHCVSSYPVPRGSENLRAIATLGAVLQVPVGLSDHASDTSGVPVAVALGASLYERHIILDDRDDAIDAVVSSTPKGFATLIQAAARAAESLGSGIKTVLAAEAPNAASRRGLYATQALAAGHVVAAGDVIALRPATVLTPDKLPLLVGARLTRDVAAGTAFLASDLQERRGAA